MSQEHRYQLKLEIIQSTGNITVPLVSANYSLNRPADPSYNNPNDYYVNIIPKSFNQELLLLISEQGAVYNGFILATDSFGQEKVRRIDLIELHFASLSEGFYTYGSPESNCSLVLYAKEILIDRIPIKKGE
ncbi:MAG: hypothetical protein KIT80_20925 [Chitinophagaceae bacterium]|nr:hypothetical protein [Chitinophagaceae bacterium]MCW5929397.1 hypothetical protein [Chitinophagaceae bacterium]